MAEKNEHEGMRELLNENQELLAENNKLLKKLHRATVWAFWFRIMWFLVIIGIPFVFYYYVMEPYFTSLGSSFETFQEGLQEVPGWKQFHASLKGEVDVSE